MARRQEAVSCVTDVVTTVSVKTPSRFKMDNKSNSLCADPTYLSNVGFPGLFVLFPPSLEMYVMNYDYCGRAKYSPGSSKTFV